MSQCLGRLCRERSTELKPPKMADIEKLDDFSHWLADTIQQAVSKENAGFVQVVRASDGLEISNGTHQFVVALKIGGGNGS